MDPISFAQLHRAQSQIQAALSDSLARAKSAAFIDAAFVILAHDKNTDGRAALRNHANTLVQKAAAHATLDAEWNGSLADLAANYLASAPEPSLLDAIARYARPIPTTSRQILVASDAVGNLVSEGDPVPVKHLDMSTADMEPSRSAGLIVLSRELIRTGGDAVRRLFERELAEAVTRAGNSAVLSEIVTSDAIPVAGTGDPLADLRAGIRAAGPSAAYVVAAPAGDVAALALEPVALPGFTVRGGELRPGIHVVAIDGADDLTIIPASRFAVWLGPLEIRSAEHATIDMRETPEAPAAAVSLWQTGCLGLMVERSWHLAQADDVVVVSTSS